MAKCTVDIEFMTSTAYRMTFDDASPEFKEALTRFQSSITFFGNPVESMLKLVAGLYGDQKKTNPYPLGKIMVNGVETRSSEKEETFSGINLEIIYEVQEEMEYTPVATCSICGCTEDNACTDGDGMPCGWANDEKTLCTHCNENGKSSSQD